MKKYSIVLLVFLIQFMSGSITLNACDCPDGYDEHEKYTYGTKILCDRTGDTCCTPNHGGSQQ